MYQLRTLFIVALGLGIALAGCGVRDAGTPAVNQPPTTILTVAPNNGTTVNHYITLRWAGNDPDGTVVGYNLYDNGALLIFTTATDTAIAFTATTNGELTEHIFAVASVDEEGAVDATPDARTFNAINFAPVAHFNADATIQPDSTVGRGFRVTIAAQDSNPSIYYYAVALDDTGATDWTPWSLDSVFIYADPAIIADAALFPEHVTGLSNVPLTDGGHTVYARVKDAGNAVSNTVALHFTVDGTLRPRMNPTVTGAYGTATFYPDGSVYWSSQFGILTQIAFEVDASLLRSYGGEVNGYRWRLGDTPWSNWQAQASLDTANLPAGEYAFQFMARDIAGALSDTVNYYMRLVVQTLSDSIIIVDETRNGSGAQGLPDDQQVDDFYATVLAPYKFRQIDWDLNQIGGESYLSPYDVSNAGLIVWHGDDRSAVEWNNAQRLLNDFLGKGGRLVLSGWDVMKPFLPSGDSIVFSNPAAFPQTKMRLLSATRNAPRTVLGFDGENGFPGCTLDSMKILPSWHGLLDQGWVFRPKGEAIVIGRLMVSDSTTNPRAHRPTAYIYDQKLPDRGLRRSVVLLSHRRSYRPLWHAVRSAGLDSADADRSWTGVLKRSCRITCSLKARPSGAGFYSPEEYFK